MTCVLEFKRSINNIRDARFVTRWNSCESAWSRSWWLSAVKPTKNRSYKNAILCNPARFYLQFCNVVYAKPTLSSLFSEISAEQNWLVVSEHVWRIYKLWEFIYKPCCTELYIYQTIKVITTTAWRSITIKFPILTVWRSIPLSQILVNSFI